MFRFLVIACVVISCCQGAVPRLQRPPPRFDGRVIGGEDANIENIPYQLSMEYMGSHRCGASIVSNDWAVTAAHCVVDYVTFPNLIPINDIKLRAGSSVRGTGGTVHQASQVIAHSKFTFEEMDCDVAVVKVSAPFVYGVGIAPISLTTTEPSAGEIATVSGWGLTSPTEIFLPTRLQVVQEPIVDHQKCNDIYYNQFGDITENMICAGYEEGGKEACNGDSGGPLVVGGKLAGIVSWGGICNAFVGDPIVYSNVASLRDFIVSQTGAATKLQTSHPRSDARVIGGEDANIEDIPYQLSLEMQGSHMCGASIISNDWALRAGSSIRGSGGTVHQPSKVIAHPQFSFEDRDCDIAVIKVSSPFIYGVGVGPISITTTEPSTGEIATVSGWGRTSPGATALPSRLQAVQEPIVDHQKCNDTYFYQVANVTENMICAGYEGGGKEACNGDSGGPLVVNGKLAGIVSWGGICNNFVGDPIVYSNVASLRDFIVSQTGATPRSPKSRLYLSGRIIGGEDTNIEALPYQLSLEILGSHLCGAAIISNEWALTAAHCVNGLSLSDLQFRAGSSIRGSGGSIHRASDIIAHPQYNYSTGEYDIAVVKVSSPFIYGTGIQPIPLTTTEPEAGTIAVASGWGITSVIGSPSYQLQVVELSIVAPTICNMFYGYLTENMICAGEPQGGKDVCWGDTGGPLAVDGKLVGITGLSAGCDEQHYPSVFTNVANLRDFVVSNTGVN
ncbi:hypothetical protein C0J52_14793 [Blattella germanica]|nr:hypothetical protein C0J52_14793 [Blattella germanica]